MRSAALAEQHTPPRTRQYVAYKTAAASVKYCNQFHTEGTCKMSGVGKCQRVKCEEKCGSHPAIYRHEHTSDECGCAHCIGPISGRNDQK